MAKYISILTDYGTQALAKALANNQPLRLMQFAVGDGNGQAVTPNANRTALVNETHRANVSAVTLDPRNNKQIIVELTIPENVGGFFVREMGVFDEQNKLIAYANTPESYKPTLESGSGKIQVLRMVLMGSSSNAVTLSVDNSVIFVTRGQLTPHTITATTANSFDQNGHSHAIDKASTTNAGIVQLTDDTGLDSDKLGLTARAGKKLAQWIANLQLALNNYIPLNKRSSAVNSNSNENVATSAAVKTAYDKAVNAENLANTKWTAKSATETEAGILPISHKTDGTSKEKFASEYAVGEAAKNLQNKADLQHSHTTLDIIDFNTGVIQVVKNITRKNYEITIKGTSNWDNAKSKSIKVIGETVIYPNGKIEQYFYLESVRISWFADEQAYGDVIKGKEILLQLWTAMPNKIDFVAGYISNAKNTRLSPRTTVAGEALEWYPIVWMFDKQQGLKDRFFMTTRRITGGADEYVDIFIKVEGY